MKKNLLILFIISAFTGCLEFGEDTELSAKKFNITVLNKITKVTGIIFPTGSQGQNYFYAGSGIDDALAAKVVIPENKKQEFLKNIIFRNGQNRRAYYQIGKNKSWWKLENMKGTIHRLLDFPNGSLAECSLGREAGELVVYISWISV